jgi:(p)ppGpp synthase/HD superfamily hydrolase
MEPNLIEKAARIGASAHQGQTRKEGPFPYIEHPVITALILMRYGFSDAVVAAALVHDVLEDTNYRESDMREALGDVVMSIIASVTNDDTLDWEAKKKKYIETVRTGSPEAKAVATADKIANARSLLIAYVTQGSEIWEHFTTGREKKLWFENAMLAMLRETWQHPLVDEYAVLVDKMNALV